MKNTLLLSILFAGVVSARRSAPIPSNNVHRLGWGLEDDVYFSEPQKVTTFQEEHRQQEANLKMVKPVKRVVVKPVQHEAAKHECLGPWGLPKMCEMEDWMGIE